MAAQPGWPEEARFRGDVVQAGPALVVTMFVRTRARWFAFGEVDGRWKQVGEDDGVLDDSPRRLMKVYGLRAGRAGAARFLAVRNFFGCAGSSGISYEVLEWNAREPGGYMARHFEAGRGVRHGRGRLDGRGPSAKEPFWPVGRLVTDGPVLELPYCMFTGIDTWDNPSLCALDRYDLRGGAVRFLSRRYNRPELAPVAKAMEYAGAARLAGDACLLRERRAGETAGVRGRAGDRMRWWMWFDDGRGKRVWFGERESW